MRRINILKMQNLKIQMNGWVALVHNENTYWA